MPVRRSPKRRAPRAQRLARARKVQITLAVAAGVLVVAVAVVILWAKGYFEPGK